VSSPKRAFEKSDTSLFRSGYVATFKRLSLTAVLVAIPICAQQASIQYAQNFPGPDVGAQINAAYAALPPAGGQIVVSKSATFATPITFNTQNKPVLLTGLPGDIVNLTYLGVGTAIHFDYSTQHRMGHGMRDLTLTGPGNFTASVGIEFGGSFGAEGIEFRDFKIQSFGTNVKMASHVWLALFQHGMIRDGGINVLLPSGLTEAGEQITFDHVTFADAPAPHVNSVWAQGGGQEVIFTNCSFDQAQLRIGIGTEGGSAAQVAVRGTHFENPNWAIPGSVNYDFIVVDNNPGNLLRLSDCYFLEDAPALGPREFLVLNGGMTMVSGIGMYTPSALASFAVLSNNAQIIEAGFYDLSGNISGPRYARR
jgi:hypothetical protein